MANEIFLGTDCLVTANNGTETKFICNSRYLIDKNVLSAYGEGRTAVEAENDAKLKLAGSIRKYKSAIKEAGNGFAFTANRGYISESTNLGGGNRPISEAQIRLIENLAADMQQKSDELARLYFGKSLDNLLGREAHDLIQRLKSADKGSKNELL